MRNREPVQPSEIICFLAQRHLQWRTQPLVDWYSRSGAPSLGALVSEQQDEIRGALRAMLRSREAMREAEGVLKRCHREGITTVCFDSPGYPEALRQIADPPLLLFLRGETKLDQIDFMRAVSVVGSRHADIEGCRIAHQISRDIAHRGGCVVSGLAIGVDAEAHRGALVSGQRGATLAVLGNGIDQLYPRTNEKLGTEILSAGGIVISQFEPGTPAFPRNFLNRNRVIAGLVPLVLVVQASERSGSLVTARYALESGREVGAVPGSPLNPRCAGTNELIRSGAAVVRGIDDLLELLPDLTKVHEIPTGEQGTGVFSPMQQQILEALRKIGRQTVPELRTQIQDHSTWDIELLKLELEGAIVREPGEYIRLVR